MHIIGVTGLSRSGKDTAAEYFVQNYNYKKIAFADVLKQACAILLDRPLIDMYEGDRESISSEWGDSLEDFFTEIAHTKDLKKAERYFHAFEILMNVQWSKEIALAPLPKRDYSFSEFLTYIENFKVNNPESFTNYETDNEGKIIKMIPGFSIRQFLQFMGTEVLRNFRDDFHVVRLELEIGNLSKRKYKGVVISDLRFENEASFIRNNNGLIIKIERDGLAKMSHVSEAGITLTENDYVIGNNGTLFELFSTLGHIFEFEKLRSNLNKTLKDE